MNASKPMIRGIQLAPGRCEQAQASDRTQSREPEEVPYLLERLRHIEQELEIARGNLEARVRERTDELEAKNQRLRVEENRLRQEQQYARVRKMESLGVLAGGIAHDFNNLLTSILGNAELALEEVPSGSPVWENLREIKNTSFEAAGLCRQMLAYSGRGRFMLESICLRNLILEMEESLRMTLSGRVRLNLCLDDGATLVRGDAAQIRQVILNLITNASEAIGERDGLITVTAGVREWSAEDLSQAVEDNGLPSGDYVWLEVTDDGCGMNEATQQRAFDPFFSTKFTGRGLGLPAVLGIIRGHKGALFLRSEPARGSSLLVLFPAFSPVPVADTTGTPLPECWRGSGTVLLVDDEEPVQRTAQRMLERLGFQVVVAGDGLAAVEVLRQRPGQITAVLLDLTMPRMNGEETLLELRKVDPQVCVVMSSGYDEADITSRLSDPGPAGFVQKPYTFDQLALQVRLALEHPGSRL